MPGHLYRWLATNKKARRRSRAAVGNFHRGGGDSVDRTSCIMYHTLWRRDYGAEIYHTFDCGERITISVVMASRSETRLGHVPTAMSNEGKMSRGVAAILGRLVVPTHNASAAGPPDVQVTCRHTQAPKKHFTNDIYEWHTSA